MNDRDVDPDGLSRGRRLSLRRFVDEPVTKRDELRHRGRFGSINHVVGQRRGEADFRKEPHEPAGRQIVVRHDATRQGYHGQRVNVRWVTVASG